MYLITEAYEVGTEEPVSTPGDGIEFPTLSAALEAVFTDVDEDAIDHEDMPSVEEAEYAAWRAEGGLRLTLPHVAGGEYVYVIRGYIA